jgi:hypothetical protein
VLLLLILVLVLLLLRRADDGRRPEAVYMVMFLEGGRGGELRRQRAAYTNAREISAVRRHLVMKTAGLLLQRKSKNRYCARAHAKHTTAAATKESRADRHHDSAAFGYAAMIEAANCCFCTHLAVKKAKSIAPSAAHPFSPGGDADGAAARSSAERSCGIAAPATTGLRLATFLIENTTPLLLRE